MSVDAPNSFMPKLGFSALRWALAQPGVVSALVGVKREEQIDEAAGAVR